MAKQEYKILEFHGGSNNKFDARDIADNQNVESKLSVRKPGRLVLEGSAKTLYTDNGTQINNHGIENITTSTGGFEKGCGLFSYSHDYNMDSTPLELDTNFICINDANGIDIYDPNQSTEWQPNKFYVGSRTATVKPEYYNVDGALRACDSNFDVTDTTETVDMAGDVSITKNDTEIIHTSGTIPAESVIQIDQEIMYVTATNGSTTIDVIRGFANT